MKFTSFLIFFLFQIGVFAQSEIARFNIQNYNTNFFKNKKSYVIKDEVKNQLIFFVEGLKGSHILFFNENFECIRNLFTDELPKKVEILGHKIIDNGYLLFTNKGVSNKILCYELSNLETITDLKLVSKFIPPEEESFLGYITTDKEFFRFSILPDSSNLLIYQEENYQLKKTKSLDFSFLNIKGEYEIKKADYSLKYGWGRGLFTEINNLEADNIRIGLTSSISKVYTHNRDKLIITLDLMTNHLKYITIDLNSFDVTVDYFKKPNLSDTIKAQNSFVFDNKIFTATLNKKELHVEILDIISKQTLFSRKYTKGDMVNFLFKESKVVEFKNEVFDKFNDSSNLDMLLKKFSNQNFGLMVKEYDEQNYILTLSSNIYVHNYQITTEYASEISTLINKKLFTNNDEIPDEFLLNKNNMSFFEKFTEETTKISNSDYGPIKNAPKLDLSFNFNGINYFAFLGAQDKNWYIYKY